jgi:hypothetical protein
MRYSVRCLARPPSPFVKMSTIKIEPQNRHNGTGGSAGAQMK